MELNSYEIMHYPLEYAHQAAAKQIGLYEKTLQQWQKGSSRPPVVLDFGTGRSGTGRVFLEAGVERLGGELHLYDQHSSIIEPPKQHHTRIVETAAISGPQQERYDIINLSYVLGTMPALQARRMLTELQFAQPQAIFIIVDYILRHRNKAEALRILQTDSERREQERQGVEPFLASRMQHDVSSLWQTMQEAGITQPHHATLLDAFPSRMGIVASRESGIMFPPPLFPGIATARRHLLSRIQALLAYAGGACMKRIEHDAVRQCIEALRYELVEIAQKATQQWGEMCVLSEREYQRQGIEECIENDVFLERACALEQRVQRQTSVTQRVRIASLKAQLDVARIFRADSGRC